MLEKINSIISKLDKIPVSGVNAILMGDALKELILLREEESKPKEEEESKPKEGEEECQQ